MTAMQISQIVFVAVIFLALVVKSVENSELENELELLNDTYKMLLDFKRGEIAELKRMLEAYEEAQPHD